MRRRPPASFAQLRWYPPSELALQALGMRDNVRLWMPHFMKHIVTRLGKG